MIIYFKELPQDSLYKISDILPKIVPIIL